MSANCAFSRISCRDSISPFTSRPPKSASTRSYARSSAASGHYNMKAYLNVMSQEDFDKWLKSQSNSSLAALSRDRRDRECQLHREVKDMSEASAHAVHHGPPTSFIRKHVFSLDHKVIGKQYYALALVAVFIGMVLVLAHAHPSGLAERADPRPAVALESRRARRRDDARVLPVADDHARHAHGLLCPHQRSVRSFGNYFLPIQIGAEDMAFPRFNMMSFWTTFVAFCILIAAFFVPDGPPISGWTAYAPLSAVGKDAGPGEGLGQTLWGISIFVFCIASLLGSLNFIATTLDLRTKGMTLVRMPIFTWAWFITSCIALLAFAVLLPACLLLILDRVARNQLLHPRRPGVSDHLQPHSGGSPLLWQHLFWFFGHPEVYIAILPAIGIVSPHPDQQHAQAAAEPQSHHLLHDGHRLPQLHGLGTSHVRQRHESVLVAGVLVPDAGDHDSRHHHDADLAGQPLRLEPAHQQRVAVLPWASSRCSSAAASADSSWRSLRSTSICTPPISWSATSTW